MDGMYFDSREDVVIFAQDQLGRSLISADEFNQRVEEIVELIVCDPRFYYAQDCSEIIESLWVRGRGFWPIGENGGAS